MRSNAERKESIRIQIGSDARVKEIKYDAINSTNSSAAGCCWPSSFHPPARLLPGWYILLERVKGVCLLVLGLAL